MSACHLCTAPLDEAPVVGTMSRGNRPSRRVACVRCGLVQTDPQPSADELAAYYRGDYHRDHGPVPMRLVHPDGRVEIVQPDEPGYVDAIDAMHGYRARMVVADLGLEPGARVLEIGCSDGRTLAELQVLGMDVRGVEPDEAMAALACDRGVVMTCGTVEDVHGTTFDAVIAFHALEHLPDPLSSLATIRGLLKPGGKVWFEVPNVYAPDPDLAGYHWQWVHLYDFGMHTLAALLARAGFDDLSVRDNRGPLQAWATHGGDGPRAYAEHGGPDGAQVAAFLAQVEAGSAPGDTLGRFMVGGESLAALGPNAERRMRLDFRDYVAAAHRVAGSFATSTETLGALSEQLAEESRVRIESWHPDPYVHGFTLGEGYALGRMSALLAYQANAMRMAEMSDGERSEG